ncbi:hypothetical protein [Megasphaera sueciensis]|uniref:hypothetical protein n=1 Tax=Megasphaera sueciensis TaxID=349094 RepID=UPI003CFECFA8
MKTTLALRQKLLTTLLAGTAVAVLTTASFIPVSANDDMASGSDTPTITTTAPAHHNPMQHRMAAMIQEGKITQDQADSLHAAMQEFHQQMKADHQKFMAQLPDKTGIDAAVLKEILPPMHGHHHPGHMKQHMDQLVQQGTLTQDQANTLETSLRDFHQSQKEEQMTARKEFMAQLPDKTGISKETLQKVFPTPPMRMKQHIDTMVQEGKITRGQGDKLESAIHDFHQKEQAKWKTFMNQLPDKTGISKETLKELFHHSSPMPSPEN